MILAGDIGGTNARIAIFEVDDRRPKLVCERIYPTREHRSLESALSEFLSANPSAGIRGAGVG